MASLAVIGNISVDTTHYTDGRRYELLGGAALHVALAATQVGLTASPISVIGDDLAHLPADPRLQRLDLAHLTLAAGRSCRFEITYGATDQVVELHCAYGVAEALTDHALAVVIAAKERHHWHVCCRRPLNVKRLLETLVAAGAPFSLDFHLSSAAEQITAAADALPKADVVFVNAAEYRQLTNLIDPHDLACTVISNGPDPVSLLRYGQHAAAVVPTRGAVTEVTGAGDTLAGTFLAEILQGAPDLRALTTAVTAASLQARQTGMPYLPR